MTWWLWLAVGGGALLAGVGYCVCVVGRMSEERRGGLLELDTPKARSALRRCNPTRDVHYFAPAADVESCECGERKLAPTIRWGDELPPDHTWRLG